MKHLIKVFGDDPKNLTAEAAEHAEKKGWKIGMMECWNIGQPIVLTIIPLFQYSSIPIPLLCGDIFFVIPEGAGKKATIKLCF